jgi:hypothetical protein
MRSVQPVGPIAGFARRGFYAVSKEGNMEGIIDFLVVKDANKVVLISVLAALLVVVISVGSVWREKNLSLEKLLAPMTDVKWDFSKSWASNVTVFGAVLASVFSASKIVFVSPSDPTKTVSPIHLSLGEYQSLTIFFALLVVAAPFLYNGIRRPKKGGSEVQYRGFVVFFLIASALTLWAVLGQIWILYLLADEMDITTDSLSPLTSGFFQLGALILAVVALIYGLMSVRDTIRYHAFGAEDIGQGPQESWSLL